MQLELYGYFAENALAVDGPDPISKRTLEPLGAV